MSDFSNRPHAAIDIGTNSMHLVVAQLQDGGGLELLTAERSSTRLGQNMDANSAINAAAMDRALETFDRFVKIAEGFDAEISAIATSAVREAKNRSEFISRAKELTGVDVETISGVEEARLIHAGIVQALDVYEKRMLAFDIGGGSTEFVIAHQGNISTVRSLKLGCIRLTDAFFPGGEADAESFAEARRYIRNYLASIQKDFKGYEVDFAVGSSGTVGAIAQAIAVLKGQSLRQLNGAEFTREEVEQVAELIYTLDAKGRGDILDLDSKRIDIITGGVALLLEIMHSLGLEKVTVSSYALREGILYDRLLGSAAGSTKNLRVDNATRLAEQLDNDPAHSYHVAGLALRLFDELADAYNFSKPQRNLLQVAALLHNVGVSISHTSHHKHSYYIIRHSDSLTGFTEREIELVAQIARFHRRAKPSEGIKEFSALSTPDKHLVRSLAGILRIAIGLDRRHLGLISDLKVTVEENLTIELVSANNELDLEIYSATQRSDLLSETFRTDIEIRYAV